MLISDDGRASGVFYVAKVTAALFGGAMVLGVGFVAGMLLAFSL